MQWQLSAQRISWQPSAAYRLMAAWNQWQSGVIWRKAWRLTENKLKAKIWRNGVYQWHHGRRNNDQLNERRRKRWQPGVMAISWRKANGG
jgi:hypothetical protein